jgi:hypothetical protein
MKSIIALILPEIISLQIWNIAAKMAKSKTFQEDIMPPIITLTLFHFCDEKMQVQILCLLNLSDRNLKFHTITTFVLDDICNSSYSVRTFMLDPMAYWSSSRNQKLKERFA